MGRPQSSDIKQDDIFNCYLVSTMGALAAQQPDRIRDAIRYEPPADNREDGTFQVTLYHPTRGKVDVPVTRSDIEFNLRENGGGIADNKKGTPIWPTVIEAAFAKLHDPNPNNNTLKDAYDAIGSETRGGSLGAGMFALTGEPGTTVRIGERPPRRTDGKPLSAPPGSTGEANSYEVDNKGVYVADENIAFTRVRAALDAGRPITLSTLSKETNDGLMENHAYMLTDIRKDQDDVWLTLRNPYATNRQVPPERGSTSDPEISVKLERLIELGSFGEFNIGPAPRLQTQTSANYANDPRNPEHPDHKLYAQIEAGVKRIDAEKGREFDSASERLALAAFRDAKTAGITSADHIELNQAGKLQPDGSQIAAGTSLFVVQGKDPSDPLALRSMTDVKQAIDQPVEHHLQKIEQLQQQQTQAQTQGQVMDNPTQADIAPKGPKL